MKIAGYAFIIFSSIALFFGGIFFVGDSFLTKSYDHHDERADGETLREETRRAERIESAKSANKDDFQVRSLQEDLKRMKYEKQVVLNDLLKLAEESKESDLKVWYFAQEDEDLEQIKGYRVIYKEEGENALGKVREYKEKLEVLEKQESEIELFVEKRMEKRDVVLRRAEFLSERAKKALVEYESAKKEYLGTPTYRRLSAEKNLKNRERIVAKIRKELNKVLSNVESIDSEITKAKTRISIIREDADYQSEQRAKWMIRVGVFNKASVLASAALICTESIRDLKARILKFESSREDKRIEVQIQ